ncbi:uncharacterized protein LOC105703975 [Orussus abietinus]|uniref:uncharacterized protein LOC105703975 n=1 Tax=Orussus abietinus TaxID=222816 RepID=UPI000625D9B3|nr:uncharacterized protein LOC105703975 [Orussus abietinus]
MDRLMAALAFSALCTLCSGGYLGPVGPAPARFAPPAPVGQDGNVIDTPEVAQAKAAHFAEFARAANRAAENAQRQGGHAVPQGHNAGFAYNSPAAAAPAPSYSGHYPQPVPQQYGYEQRSYPTPRTTYVSQGPKSPFVPAPLAEDGTVVDTPEVAALKAARLAELADAEARAYKFGGTEEYQSPGQGYSAPQGASNAYGGVAQGALKIGLQIRGVVKEVVDGYRRICCIKLQAQKFLWYRLKAHHEAFDLGNQIGPVGGQREGRTTHRRSSLGEMALRLIVVTSAALAAATLVEAKYLYEYTGTGAPLSPDGSVVDTPEVARARAAHMAAYAEAAARVVQEGPEYMDDYYEHALDFEVAPYEVPVAVLGPARVYQGPAAPLARDGRVVDTPEVARAKAAHLAAHARETAAVAEYEVQYEPWMYEAPEERDPWLPVKIVGPISPARYQGPPAPLGPDGRVVDTPEVARARAAHLKAHARAASLAGPHGPEEFYRH